VDSIDQAQDFDESRAPVSTVEALRRLATENFSRSHGVSGILIILKMRNMEIIKKKRRN
jgi:hypothetical protein